MWILNHYLIRDSESIIFIYRMQLLINRHYRYHIFHNSSFLNILELHNTHVKIEVHTFYRFTIHFSGYKLQYIFCYQIVWLLSTCLHLLQFLKKWKQSWLLDFVLLTVAQMYQKLVFSGGCSRMEKGLLCASVHCRFSYYIHWSGFRIWRRSKMERRRKVFRGYFRIRYLKGNQCLVERY